MDESHLELTLEEMVGTTLKVFDTDPVLIQQFPKFFYFYKKSADAAPQVRPSIPRTAKRFLRTRQVPRDHQIETNFHPYFKANYQIKKRSAVNTPCKDFDLADEQLKIFNDENFSLNRLVRSNSPVRASRLPTSSTVNRLETSKPCLKSRSNSLSKPQEKPSHRMNHLSSTRNRFLYTRSSPLNTYKAFKLIL
jgi:hypothetical protein